ncbi:hypothetical protein [Vibrio kanaloae]|uniref:hypothetical protein n=1 Tax=Vibrio kanaloae TaxID=170673 RepID=UPI001484CA62|nr:hypothetical protein [Vibrio kanaloae]
MKVTTDLKSQPPTFDTTLTIVHLIALCLRILRREKTKKPNDLTSGFDPNPQIQD